MKLTKYGHACVIIEHQGRRLVIDAGDFTELPKDLDNIDYVVCTHMHGDHTNAKNIDRIYAANPDVVVYGNHQTLDALGTDVQYRTVQVDSDVVLELEGVDVVLSNVDHATVWQQSPCKNLTVRVGDFWYYPGDSYEVSAVRTQVVAVPLVAPWSKLTDAIQFVHDSNCDQVFPTHNGILNDVGHEIYNFGLGNFTKDTDKEVVLLKNGESIIAR